MYRILFLLSILAVLAATPARALSQVPYDPFKNPSDSMATIKVVVGYLSIDASIVLDSVAAARWTTPDLVQKILQNNGLPLRFPRDMPYQITGAHALAYSDSAAIVTLAALADTLPRFGPLTVDWVYFLVRTGAGWRIATFERQRNMEGAIERLRSLDTSAAFPSSLKPIILREMSGGLMSNAQIREFFTGNRAKFKALADILAAEPNLRRLARIDRKAGQINNVNIEWSGSAQVVPQEAIDEFLKSATSEEKEQMNAELYAQARLRRMGDDTVKAISKRMKIRVASLQKAIDAMYDVRANFLNRDLPWKDAVQLTLGGEFGFSVGVLYSPRTELPLVSPTEYYFLEDLGGGWWLFRAK